VRAQALFARLHTISSYSLRLAQLQAIGDECFAEGLYQAARAIFAQIGNWVRLASTHVKLGQYQAAFDAAKKAMTIRSGSVRSRMSGGVGVCAKRFART